MTMYFESDYDKNLREQRVNNVVKDYGILVRPKVSGVSVSENYAESAILKLTKMILSIFDDYNLNDFYINSDVCIEYADLLKLKDLARDIIGDIVCVNKE